MKNLRLIVCMMWLVFALPTILQAQSYSKPSVVRIDSDAQLPDKNRLQFSERRANNEYDDFTYYTSSSGIYISFQKPNNEVKLFALTGQVLWSGESVSGKFYIPTGEGIFFLRVNNKTHKISCK